MQDAFPQFMKPYVPMIQGVVTAVAIFIAGWLASKVVANLIQRALKRARVEDALTRFLSSLSRYTILTATVITALGAVGVQTTSLVAIFASAGLAVGLALQGSLANFASGVLILFFRPFTLGDEVTISGQTGKVEDIGIFTTTLLNPRNDTVIIPNGKVTGDIIINLTAKGKRLGSVEISVAYGFDLKKVQEVLLQAAGRVDLVLKDPLPVVALTHINDNGMIFTVSAWSTSQDYLGMLSHLRQTICEDLTQAGIESPVNQVVVYQAKA